MRRALAALLLGAVASASRASSGGPYQLGVTLADAGGGGELAGGEYSLQGALGQSLPPGRPSGGALVLRRGFFDPPKLSLQGGMAHTIVGPGGAVLTLPAGAVASPYFEAAIRRDPGSRPLKVDPAAVAAANEKMRRNRGPLAEVRPSDVWEVALHDEAGFLDGALLAPGALSLPFLDADGNGFVDGTSPPRRVSTLDLWRLDEERLLWVKEPGARSDPAQGNLATPLSHLSVFALIGGAATAVAEAYAFPVPFRPNGPNAGTGPGQTGTAAAGITFANLPSEGLIEVYTLDGRLVRRLAIPPNLIPAALAWDVKNEAGNPVVSGVYIWRVASGGNAKMGRLMVIR